MPIYAYRCAECGHAKDVLQKLSDAPLTTCPACQAEAFQKQVTAAGFQLKGNGWYATDFKNGGSAAPAAASSGSDTDKAASAASGTPAGASAGSGGADSAASSAATPAASPASAPSPAAAKSPAAGT
ncbi:FmdB family zinc ribbon protein [Roseateles sp. GG27B]